jgi:hypothetical protein
MRHLSKSGIITLKALGGPIGSRTAQVQEQQLEETKFIAFFMGKKIDIDGKDLYDAKQKAITQLKVPKSKVGLLAVVSAESQKNQDFRFESVNEGLKHLIHVETPKEIVSKSVASQIMALAKKGVRSNEIGLNMHFVGDEKAAVGAFQKVKNKIYFDLDTNESVNEGKKAFKVNPGIGKAKYSISSHDGKKKHNDGGDFWDIEIFKNKVDLEKGIKKYTSNGFVKESLNEAASEEAKEIGALTGVRGDAVQKFIDDNNIHARKLLAYLKMKGPHTLSNRMDISTAIVGKANNKFAQGIIKAFSESIKEASLSWAWIDRYANAISNLTQIDTKDVKKFIEDNKLNIEKIFAIAHKTSQGKTDFIKAIKAAPNSSIQNAYVKTYANESVTEGKKAFRINPQIGKAKYSISAHNGVSKHKDGSDFWDILIFKNKADLERRAKYFRGENYIEESVNESIVNEGRYDADLDKIEAVVKNATSFMNVGSELKKAGIKYDFTTSMIPMYMIKVSGNTIAICNKKYAAGAEREVKDIAIGLLN